MIAVLVGVGGTLMSFLEPETVRGGIGGGIWWAIVTVSTVGYGDISPTSVPGRVVAVVLMLGGIGLVSTLAASISAFFIGQDQAKSRVVDRLDRIEAMVAEIRAATVVPESTPTEDRAVALVS
jgi:voltage-gated potassium channel